eukprot:scaffold221_cov122-Isochrysis_galbana.AAC.5
MPPAGAPPWTTGPAPRKRKGLERPRRQAWRTGPAAQHHPRPTHPAERGPCETRCARATPRHPGYAAARPSVSR